MRCAKLVAWPSRPAIAMRTPSRVFEALAEHHVAAALAMHRPRRGEVREPLAEARRRRRAVRRAARDSRREASNVAILRRRLIGERRERHDLRAGAPPAVEHMRVDEAEGRVLRQRDALARRRDRRVRLSGRKGGAARRKLQDGVEIEMALRHRRPGASSRAARFACSPACTRPRWRSGSASAASRGIAPSTGMPRAAMASATSRRCRSLPTRFSTTPPIRTSRIVRGEAAHQRRRRLRLARRRRSPAAPAGKNRAARSAEAPVRRGAPANAVEQAHRAFDHQQIGMRAASATSASTSEAAWPSCRD